MGFNIDANILTIMDWQKPEKDEVLIMASYYTNAWRSPKSYYDDNEMFNLTGNLSKEEEYALYGLEMDGRKRFCIERSFTTPFDEDDGTYFGNRLHEKVNTFQEALDIMKKDYLRYLKECPSVLSYFGDKKYYTIYDFVASSTGNASIVFTLGEINKMYILHDMFEGNSLLDKNQKKNTRRKNRSRNKNNMQDKNEYNKRNNKGINNE